MIRKYFCFLIMFIFSVGVFGQRTPVNDPCLEELKEVQKGLKENIKSHANTIKTAQTNIKRALIGCRRECDFCKNDQEKFTSDGNVDPGCPEGGYVSQQYACARMQECMEEQYKKDLDKAERSQNVSGKNIVGTEFNLAAVLSAYNAVANSVIGPVKVWRTEDLHQDYPVQLNHPPKQSDKDLPNTLKQYQQKETPLFAAFRQRRVESDKKKTVLGYLRNPDNSPQQKLAFVSLHLPVNWEQMAGNTSNTGSVPVQSSSQAQGQNKPNALRFMEEQIMRTYFHDKTGCYGNKECYEAYRNLTDDERRNVQEAGNELQTGYHNLRQHYVEELSTDSLSVFAAMHQSQSNNTKFYSHPALGKQGQYGGSYLDDILYNTELMQGVYLQTAMETLAELRMLELTVARLLLDGEIDLAVHPAYLDAYIPADSKQK